MNVVDRALTLTNDLTTAGQGTRPGRPSRRLGLTPALSADKELTVHIVVELQEPVAEFAPEISGLPNIVVKVSTLQRVEERWWSVVQEDLRDRLIHWAELWELS